MHPFVSVRGKKCPPLIRRAVFEKASHQGEGLNWAQLQIENILPHEKEIVHRVIENNLQHCPIK
jgi:hypothetical protein